MTQTTLRIDDFAGRWFNVGEVFIRLGETLLISRYQPVWNVVADGFGNKTEGAGRTKGERPIWDLLHPGRAFAQSLKVTRNPDEIRQRISTHFQEYPPHDGEFV